MKMDWDRIMGRRQDWFRFILFRWISRWGCASKRSLAMQCLQMDPVSYMLLFRAGDNLSQWHHGHRMFNPHVTPSLVYHLFQYTVYSIHLIDSILYMECIGCGCLGAGDSEASRALRNPRQWTHSLANLCSSTIHWKVSNTSTYCTKLFICNNLQRDTTVY